MCTTLKEMYRVVVCLATALAYCNGLRPRPVCDRGGICMPLDECALYRDKIHSYGWSRQVKAELRALSCGFEGRRPLICCPSPEMSSHGKHRNLRLLPTECGPIPVSDRIINGPRAELNQFPWMVQLLYKDNGRLMHKCGGTLINERYVLTAAHCILKSLEQVVLGEHDVTTVYDCEYGANKRDEPEKCYRSQKIFISEKDVTVHENFTNMVRPKNDIALIRLPKPANFSLENIKPICLPHIKKLQDQKLEGICSAVAGWGIATHDTTYHSSVLSYANLLVTNKHSCTKFKRKDSVDSQLCTVATGKKGQCGSTGNSCIGDSGGPLFHPARFTKMVKMVQWGIVSFGARTCKNHPAVYTRVASFMNWILDNIEE